MIQAESSPSQVEPQLRFILFASDRQLALDTRSQRLSNHSYKSAHQECIIGVGASQDRHKHRPTLYQSLQVLCAQCSSRSRSRVPALVVQRDRLSTVSLQRGFKGEEQDHRLECLPKVLGRDNV